MKPMTDAEIIELLLDLDHKIINQFGCNSLRLGIEKAIQSLSTRKTVDEWTSIDDLEPPIDGTEILIKTYAGIVSAWYNSEPSTTIDDGIDCWVCYDDMFQIDVDLFTEDGNPIHPFTHWKHIDTPKEPEGK